jgi:predicted SAM-dependent methyltransferase
MNGLLYSLESKEGSILKLHIGCGNKYLPGFKHVDIMPYDHIDYLTSADKLDMISDNSVEEIYACHILEHFKRNEVIKVLQEWNRVLVPDGVLRLAVPDFEAIVEKYLEDRMLDNFLGLLFGRQSYVYNFHFMTFDFKYLERILKDVGFCDIERYDWKEFLPEGFDDYSRAYLPHMDFNGRLMSLNVTGRKL